MTIECLRAALYDVFANKLRSGLTVLGILIGTAAVILLVAVGVGIANEVQHEIRKLGVNTIYVFPETHEAAERGGTGTRVPRLTRRDVRALSDRQRAPAVASVAAMQETSGVVTWDGTSYTLKTFEGCEPSYAAIRNLGVKSGRLLTDEDEASRAKVALVGPTLVQHLMGRNVDPVGQDVVFNGVRLRIVGVLTPRGADGIADEDDVMIAPLSTTAEHIVGSAAESYSHVVVQAASRAALPQAIDQMTAVLRQTHQLPDDGPLDFELINAGRLAETEAAQAAAFQLFLGAIALISLIVGGIGVMNIMLVTVTERTHEIGIRRALGAQQRDVVVQFLAEAMLLAGLGGVLGVLVGVGLGQLPVGGSKPVVDGSTVVVSLLVSVLVGVFFGMYPARRAAALTPIEALRYE